MKTCKRCGETKTPDAFSPFKKSKDGLFSWCKACNTELQKGRYSKLSPEERTQLNRHRRGPVSQKKAHDKQMDRYRNDPEYRQKIREQQRLRYQENSVKMKAEVSAKRYGISVEEYQVRMLQPCEICGDNLGVGKAKMTVDHNHETGALRGTLCHYCNVGLGGFRDKPELLEAAIAYLRSWY